MAFVYDEDFTDGPGYTLDDIRASTNVAQLCQWLDEGRDRMGDMKIQVEAALLCDNYEDAWMDRIRHAMSFTGIGNARLEKRLKALGVNPHPKADRDELAQARAEATRHKANCAKAQASAEFGRNLLASVKAHVSPAVYDVIVSDAATRAAAFVEQVAKEAA